MRVVVDIVSILFEVLSEEIIQVLLVFFEVFPKYFEALSLHLQTARSGCYLVEQVHASLAIEIASD